MSGVTCNKKVSILTSSKGRQMGLEQEAWDRVKKLLVFKDKGCFGGHLFEGAVF